MTVTPVLAITVAWPTAVKLFPPVERRILTDCGISIGIGSLMLNFNWVTTPALGAARGSGPGGATSVISVYPGDSGAVSSPAQVSPNSVAAIAEGAPINAAATSTPIAVANRLRIFYSPCFERRCRVRNAAIAWSRLLACRVAARSDPTEELVRIGRISLNAVETIAERAPGLARAARARR